MRPKTTRFTLTAAELNIDGYDLFTRNIAENTGRGIAIYTATHLQAYEVQLSTEYTENIAVCIRLNEETSTLFTCIYRSPSSTPTNNTNLNDLIKEIDSTKHHLKILVGDFNFPSISWKDLHCNSSNLEANTFKQTVLDCYMTQHIDFPTRARGTDNPSCLDYIFTNSEELINNVLDTSPLGNSDHTVIQADINVKVMKKQKPFKKYSQVPL